MISYVELQLCIYRRLSLISLVHVAQDNWCCGPFLQCWAGLPPTVLGPSVLNKGVETVPIATQFSPTIPRLSGACLWQTELL